MIITSNLKGVMIDVKPRAATKRGWRIYNHDIYY